MRSSISNNSLSRFDSLSPIEYEIEALSSIYPEQLEKIQGKPNYEMRIFLKPNPLMNLNGKEPICWAKLFVKFNEGYPKIMPEIEIYDKYNITNREVEKLNEGIDEIAWTKSNENSEMVYDICRYIEKFLDNKSKAYGPSRATSPKELPKPSQRYNKLSPVVLKNDKNDKNLNIKNNKNNLFRKLSFEKSRTLSEMNKEDVKFMRNVLRDDFILDSDNKLKHSNLNMNMNELSDYNGNLKMQPTQNISRLLTDFEIIEKIGQGGGGTVYKVRHNIDKQFYAIKKIKLCTKKNPEIILKEVMLLSRLQHPNIVRYYQAWYEDYENFEEENDEDEYEVNSDSDGENENNDNTNVKDSSDKNDSNSDIGETNSYENLKFKNKKEKEKSNQYNTSNNSNNSDSMVMFEEPSNDKIKNNVWEVEDDTSYYEEIKKEKNHLIKYLIIQMEYCEGQTLREAIDKKVLQDEKITWKIIIQVIDALSYIHRKRLIHRDIKPANIFLDKKYNVKLGDFGLATVTKPKSAIENLNLMSKKEFIKTGGDLLSCGIGTMYYCSPEQEKNNKYDEKTDMFSLGIVIFEMFFTFGSLMERDIVLRNIKDNHKFPAKFESSAPIDAIDIIKKMTIRDPQLRPSSHELLNSTLVSRNYNEKTVLDNLNKMIEENKPFYLKVIDAVFVHKLLEIEDEKEIHHKTQSNDLINNYEYTHEHYYTKLNQLGQINIRTFNFIFSTYNKICEELRKLFKRENVDYIKFAEIESFYNFVHVFDSVKNCIVKIEDLNQNFNKLFISPIDEENSKLNSGNISNNSINNLMLTNSGDLIRNSTNIYHQLGKFINQQFSNSFYSVPIRIYTDTLTKYNNNQNGRIDEKNEFIYNLIWMGNDYNNLTNSSNNVNGKNKLKIISDDDIIYERNSIELLFNFIETFDFTNNIQISINSSVILDYIFQRLQCNIEEKYETISFLSNRSNLFDSNNQSLSNIKDLIKFINMNKNLPKLPINKEKLKELLTHLDNVGDIETFNKKYDRKFDILSEEIERIHQIFNKFTKNYINLRHRIKIDFSLMPVNLITYAGIFLQVNYVDPIDKEKTIISDVGRIDNHLNNENEIKPLKFRGMTLRFYTENIFKIKIQKMKEKDYSNFKLDLVIINTVDDNNYLNNVFDYMDELKRICKENKLHCELIYKKQITTEFNDFFLAFRMKMLIIVKLDVVNKNILVEYKYIDKKKTVTKENFYMLEVLHSLDTFKQKSFNKK